MKILAIETSGESGGIALAQEGRLLDQNSTLAGRTQSRDLMPCIDRTLRSQGWAPGDLELVAVGRGPGSHNGVRVAITTAKVIAYGLKIPLVAIDSMDARAHDIDTPTDAHLTAVVDARRKNLFVAHFRTSPTPGAPPLRKSENRVLSQHDFLESLRATEHPVYLVGDGIGCCQEALLELPHISLISRDKDSPTPESVLRLALDAYCYESWDERSGHLVARDNDIHSVMPIYLLRTEAEERADTSHHLPSSSEIES